MKAVELKGVTKRFGDIKAVDNISFEVRRGQIVSLLGPSGCGKTTTLRLIAGFESLDEGVILIAGDDVSRKRPYERKVGLLFQDYALFPHMSVEQNVAYGMRRRGMAHKEIPRRTSAMLDLVRLGGFEKRWPSQLSGGQQQRVALARALATEPEVMLLDEPLSALDAKLRQELRVELREILVSVGSTTIVVTHDQEEAMSLAEHVIIQNHGRVMQQGTPSEIYSNPRNKFVAGFLGRSNWFSGRLGAEIAPGIREFQSSEGLRILVPSPESGNINAHEVCVRQERIVVTRGAWTGARPPEPHLNVIRGTVIEAVHLGADVHLTIEIPSGRRLSVTEKNIGQRIDAKGESITLTFGATDCIVVREV